MLDLQHLHLKLLQGGWRVAYDLFGCVRDPLQSRLVHVWAASLMRCNAVSDCAFNDHPVEGHSQRFFQSGFCSEF